LLAAGPAAHAANNSRPGTPRQRTVRRPRGSSAPDQVSGGDARLHIDVPHTVPLQQVEVWVNGRTSGAFHAIAGSRTLTGVIDGLVLGDNDVRVNANGNGKGRPDAVQLKLTNHPMHRPDLLRPAPVSVRVQHRQPGARPADRRRPGHGHQSVRCLGRSRGPEPQLLRRDAGGLSLPAEQRLVGAISPGDPIPPDAAATTSTGAPGPWWCAGARHHQPLHLQHRSPDPVG